MRQQQLRQLVELAYLLTALNFAPDFVVAEVPWVALQQSNFVQSLRVFEQVIQREFCRRANVINYDGLKTTLLLRERAADHVLHAAVSKSDDALLCQVVHEFSEDIKRLATHRLRLAGTHPHLPPHHGTCVPAVP